MRLSNCCAYFILILEITFTTQSWSRRYNCNALEDHHGAVQKIPATINLLPNPQSAMWENVRTDDFDHTVYNSAIPLDWISIILVVKDEDTDLYFCLERIYQHTNPRLVKEILIIDDSPNANISLPDMSSIKKIKKSNIPMKLIRNDQVLGICKSQNKAASLANGKILVFLNPYMAPEPRWILPILQKLLENSKRIVTPSSTSQETICGNTQNLGDIKKWVFDWDFSIKEIPYSMFTSNDDIIYSPVITDQSFAVFSDWWVESGQCNPDISHERMQLLEMSIRQWLCGGQVVMDFNFQLCQNSPFSYKMNKEPVSETEKILVASLWLDKYASYVSQEYQNTIKGLENILEFKPTLQCKPFESYVEQFRQYLEIHDIVKRPFFNIRIAGTDFCIEGKNSNIIDTGYMRIETCTSTASQQFAWIDNGLKLLNKGTEKCFDYNQNKVDTQISLYHCDKKNFNQVFYYVDQQILHNSLCLDVSISYVTEGIFQDLMMRPCNYQNRANLDKEIASNSTAMDSFQSFEFVEVES